MTDQTTADLMAICEICLQPVEGGEGYVWVDQDDCIDLQRC